LNLASIEVPEGTRKSAEASAHQCLVSSEPVEILVIAGNGFAERHGERPQTRLDALDSTPTLQNLVRAFHLTS
ncbi:MAG: hypothetical protein ACREKF_13470, partial [Candidatus Methylomirabilales bacterium]